VTTNPLNPDELGEKGERRFAELCADARLTCNRAERDRVGWDFVVTWPFDHSAPLDSRPAPFTCQVQLKTVWEGNDVVALNIATMEHIVKDLRPAFVVVLEVSRSDLSFVRARVMHVGDGFLGEILKRLWRARVERRSSAGIVYQASASAWGVVLPSVTGPLLRTALETAAPSGMSAYAKDKERQLAVLGFERGRMHLQTTVQATSADEVIDGFLGLVPLRIAEARQFETRFGLSLESPTLPWSDGANEGEAFISVNPKPVDRCTVTVRRAGDGGTIVMKGDLFSVPSAIAGPDRVILEARCGLTRIRVDTGLEGGTLSARITFNSVDGIDAVSASASDWLDFYRLGAWVLGDQVTVELKTKRMDSPPPLMGGTSPVGDAPRAREMERLADAAEAVVWAMLKAQAPGTRLTWREWTTAAEELAALRAMEQSPAGVTPITFVTDGGASKPDAEYELLYLNRIAIGTHYIAYAARTNMRTQVDDDAVNWVSGQLHLAHVRKIRSNDDAFLKFAREARHLSGVANWFGPGDLS